jgi:hypothetical protein
VTNCNKQHSECENNEEPDVSGETLVVIEMTLTAVLCLGFGFYQLWSLNKDKKKALLEKQQALQENKNELSNT